LSSSDVSLAAGGSENNLAFKCTRRRLVFETLHLGLEGGVGERRTTVPENVIELESSLSHSESGSLTTAKKDGGPAARVEVALEIEPVEKASEREENAPVKGKKKGKKTVAFQIDRPQLYDF
jgi:elongator complex protein 4